MSKLQRVLISVSDKTGVVDFARALSGLGIEIISTGGTAHTLRKEGIPVISIEDVTGFPEMMDGRVKTLHPMIHGALLAVRDNPEHAEQAQKAGIQWIDMVVVNLYPFEATVAKEGVALDEAIENIDIGGPSMIRSAAKNYRYVTIVTDPSDYGPVLAELQKTGNTTLETRERLALKAFLRTADYDSAIDAFLSEQLAGEKALRIRYDGGKELRYGENSHQKAVFYIDRECQEPSVASADILHGKAMSYNNYVDADAALEAVKEMEGQIGVAVIKHTNPCGYATGATPAEALERAWAGDPISAFGSVIACNAAVDLPFSEFLKGKNVEHIGYVAEGDRMIPQQLPSKFVEVIVAPDFTQDALELLSKTKTLRLLSVGSLSTDDRERMTYRKITGGILEMERDLGLWASLDLVTEKAFAEGKQRLAAFAYQSCKHTKSNAIVIAREYRSGYFQVMGMGAGQPNRVDSLRKLALTKTLENLRIEYGAGNHGLSFEEYKAQALSDMVLASDAFFPFDDTVRVAAEAGIRYIVQPGGSKRDQDSIDACNELGVAMAFTGMRHFRH